MSLNDFIIRQFIVSSVLFSALHCSSAVRYPRLLQHSAPSIRNYAHPWKYVPFIQMPRTMQRRFMWKEMDDTVDGMMGNTANSARPMTQVFSPPMVRYRKPFDFDIQPSKKVKYFIKKPPAPPPPPFKRMKVIKFRAPKQPIIPLYNHVTIAEPPAILKLTTTPKPSVVMQFMSEEDLRKIEKEQEKRVENESAGGIHEHSHQTHMDDDIVSGRINEFGQDWLPLKGPFSTPKAFAVSRLHTRVEGIATISAPTALPLVLAEPIKNKFTSSYEVTEHSAEASNQKELSFKPPTLKFDFLPVATTEGPNYPDYFLKSFSKKDEDFQPIRVPITTTFATTTTTPASRRLPPRSTTEHPFKRYNLHRPKPSKLLFHRPTSSPSDSPSRQTETPTTTENSYKVTLDLQEPVKTTRESIRTTREPSSTTTTTTTTKEPKKAPPEKVRTTRMNSERKSKLRIKNVSQNENLNKILNKHRGSVKFGEKT